MSKKAFRLTLVVICITLLQGLSAFAIQDEDTEKPRIMERIWIKENDEYTPFIILQKTESDYLLIREHTTGPCAFSYFDSESSYYANSALDNFLNQEYSSRFSCDIQEYLLRSAIEITSETSIGFCGGQTEYIERVFFIPSWTEATGKYNSSGLKEGNLFSNEFTKLALKATNDAGEPSAWWLRTPSTWYFNQVLGINEEGGVSTGLTVDSFGVYTADVRPVFRISSRITVVSIDGRWCVE